jgi:hypothetical protein
MPCRASLAHASGYEKPQENRRFANFKTLV